MNLQESPVPDKKIYVNLNSIKTKLIFSFLLIALVPTVYVSFVFFNAASSGLQKVITNSSMSHARKASVDLNNFISNQLAILKLLNQNNELLVKDIDRASTLIKDQDNRNLSIENILLLDLKGELLTSSRNKPIDFDFRSQEAQTILAEQPYFFKINRLPSGKKSVFIVAPLRDKNLSLSAFLLIEINLFQLANIISENLVGSSSIIYLLDEENALLSCSSPHCSGDEIDIISDIIENNEYGSYSISSDTMTQPLLAVYLPVVGLGWKVLLFQDQNEVYYMLKAFQDNIFYIVFFTVLGAILTAYIISQNIALPILEVTKGANQLAAGNLNVRIAVPNTDEVGQLANNFNYMADSLSGKIQELSEAYEELQDKAYTIQQTNIDLDRKVFEITILYNIGLMMAEIGMDIDRLLEIIIDKSIEAANVQRGSLMLSNETLDKLELHKVRIWDETTQTTKNIANFKKNIDIRLGEGTAGKVWETGEMIIINDPDSHPDFKQYEDQQKSVKQLCCVPLKIKNTTFGVINLVNKKDNTDFLPQDTNLLLTLANQAAMVLENAKLFKLSITDGLTDLFIVRHFKIKLNEEIRRALRYDKIFSLLFFDIDHFKKFNDTYGHQVGDEVLKQVAQLFKDSLRKDLDVPARYGGEEMIALLPETNIQGAYLVAERLRKKIAEYNFEGYDTPLHVTISIGLAEFPLHDTNMDELIKKADIALYECKKRGRNITCIYSPEMGDISDTT